MKIENIPAEIKSKSLKEAREEINEILIKLESDNYDLKSAENIYKRLIYLNKHVENLFKIKSKEILKSWVNKLYDKYKISGKKIQPEIKLILMMSASAASFHASKKMAESISFFVFKEIFSAGIYGSCA